MRRFKQSGQNDPLGGGISCAISAVHLDPSTPHTATQLSRVSGGGSTVSCPLRRSAILYAGRRRRRMILPRQRRSYRYCVGYANLHAAKIPLDVKPNMHSA
jgi:hypothetical protein